MASKYKASDIAYGGYWSGGGLSPYRYTAPITFGDIMPELKEQEATQNAAAAKAAGVLSSLPGMTGQGAYGLVPQTTSPQTTQASALAGNLAAVPNLDTLAQQYSDITSRAAAVPFQRVNPYFSQSMAQQGLNAYELAQGQLPSADIQSLANSVIANRLSRGIYSGAPNTQSALARTVLGSQLAAQQQGLANLSTLAGLTPKGAQLDLASMLVTPTQQQEWQDIANVRAAAPDPATARMANLASVFAGQSAGRGSVGSGYVNPATQPFYTPLVPQTTSAAATSYPSTGSAYLPSMTGSTTGTAASPLSPWEASVAGIDTGLWGESPYNYTEPDYTDWESLFT